ncbi:MAG: hypothetical protein R3E32_08730 [Chitinophagales bacterium]
MEVNTAIQIDLNSVLQGIALLDTDNLRIFTNEVVQLLVNRTSDSKQAKEWTIIYQIYTLVPQNIKTRYEQLSHQLGIDQLSESEHEEFMQLNEKMENFSVVRLELLIELANIRQTTVSEVMQQLGLQKPTHD